METQVTENGKVAKKAEDKQQRDYQKEIDKLKADITEKQQLVNKLNLEIGNLSEEVDKLIRESNPKEASYSEGYSDYKESVIKEYQERAKLVEKLKEFGSLK